LVGLESADGEVAAEIAGVDRDGAEVDVPDVHVEIRLAAG
jgi:hypothetical protein